jgi:hypothetical protein
LRHRRDVSFAQVSYTVVSSKQIRDEPQDAQKAPRYRVSAMRLSQGIAFRGRIPVIGSIIQDRRYICCNAKYSLRCNRQFHVNTPRDTGETI